MSSSAERPICVVSHTSELYGAPRSMLSVVTALKRSGLPTEVVTFGRGGLTAKLLRLGIDYRVVPVLKKQTHRISYRILRKAERQVGGVFYALRLLPILLAIKPRLLYVNTVARTAPFLCALLLRIPVLVHVRESRYYLHRRTLDDLIRIHLVLRVPTHYICVSRATAALLTAYGVSPLRISTIYNGLELGRYAVRNSGRQSGRIVIGFVGGMTKRKGIHVFLRTAVQLLEEQSNLHFLVVGGNPESPRFKRDLLTIIPPEKRNCFEFTGFVEDVSSHFSRIDIFCMTSEKEPFARVNLEAMVFGIPVVAFDVGGNSEAIVHGVTGYVVPAGNVRAFIAAVRELLQNPNRGRAMGARGRERVMELFTADKYIRDTLSVITRFAYPIASEMNSSTRSER